MLRLQTKKEFVWEMNYYRWVLSKFVGWLRLSLFLSDQKTSSGEAENHNPFVTDLQSRSGVDCDSFYCVRHPPKSREKLGNKIETHAAHEWLACRAHKRVSNADLSLDSTTKFNFHLFQQTTNDWDLIKQYLWQNFKVLLILF